MSLFTVRYQNHFFDEVQEELIEADSLDEASQVALDEALLEVVSSIEIEGDHGFASIDTSSTLSNEIPSTILLRGESGWYEIEFLTATASEAIELATKSNPGAEVFALDSKIGSIWLSHDFNPADLPPGWRRVMVPQRDMDGEMSSEGKS